MATDQPPIGETLLEKIWALSSSAAAQAPVSGAAENEPVIEPHKALVRSGTVSTQAYTIAAFRTAYGVGKTMIFAEIAAGRLEARKVGRRTLITSEAAARWLASLPTVKRGPA